MKNYLVLLGFFWLITVIKINGFSAKDIFSHKNSPKYTLYHADYYKVNNNNNGKDLWPHIIRESHSCRAYMKKATNYQTYLVHGILNKNNKKCIEDRSVIVVGSWIETIKNIDKEDCFDGTVSGNGIPGISVSTVFGKYTAKYDNKTYSCTKTYTMYCSEEFATINDYISRRSCTILEKALNEEKPFQKDLVRFQNNRNMSTIKINEVTFNKQTGKNYMYFVNYGK